MAMFGLGGLLLGALEGRPPATVGYEFVELTNLDEAMRGFVCP